MALAPYVAVSIMAVCLLVSVYIIVQGAIESSENNLEGSVEVGSSVSRLSNAMLQIYGYDPQDLNSTDAREVIKEDIPLPP